MSVPLCYKCGHGMMRPVRSLSAMTSHVSPQLSALPNGQALRDGIFSGQSDSWQSGCMLWELFSGPFGRGTIGLSHGPEQVVTAQQIADSCRHVVALTAKTHPHVVVCPVVRDPICYLCGFSELSSHMYLKRGVHYLTTSSVAVPRLRLVGLSDSQGGFHQSFGGRPLAHASGHACGCSCPRREMLGGRSTRASNCCANVGWAGGPSASGLVIHRPNGTCQYASVAHPGPCHAQ